MLFLSRGRCEKRVGTKKCDVGETSVLLFLLFVTKLLTFFSGVLEGSGTKDFMFNHAVSEVPKFTDMAKFIEDSLEKKFGSVEIEPFDFECML